MKADSPPTLDEPTAMLFGFIKRFLHETESFCHESQDRCYRYAAPCDHLENLAQKNFVNRLSALIPESQTDYFDWALIPNHAHLLLRSGGVPVSVFMNCLATGYAGWFNRKYRRHGQLDPEQLDDISQPQTLPPRLKDQISPNGSKYGQRK